MTGSIAASGNIISLLNFSTTLTDYAFYELFNNCTSLTAAPALLAIKLAPSCYNSMFSGCRSLTQAPVLPATTLVNSCYQNMFNGCHSLNYIKALFITLNILYTFNWVSSVSKTGTFVKSKDATWNERGINGIPDGWTVQTA